MEVQLCRSRLCLKFDSDDENIIAGVAQCHAIAHRGLQQLSYSRSPGTIRVYVQVAKRFTQKVTARSTLFDVRVNGVLHRPTIETFKQCESWVPVEARTISEQPPPAWTLHLCHSRLCLIFDTRRPGFDHEGILRSVLHCSAICHRGLEQLAFLYVACSLRVYVQVAKRFTQRISDRSTLFDVGVHRPVVQPFSRQCSEWIPEGARWVVEKVAPAPESVRLGHSRLCLSFTTRPGFDRQGVVDAICNRRSVTNRGLEQLAYFENGATFDVYIQVDKDKRFMNLHTPASTVFDVNVDGVVDKPTVTPCYRRTAAWIPRDAHWVIPASKKRRLTDASDGVVKKKHIPHDMPRVVTPPLAPQQHYDHIEQPLDGVDLLINLLNNKRS